MQLSQFTAVLKSTPHSTVRFRLPNGDLIPAHAHVTEIALINKRFIDCGGTLRETSLCRLQSWVANDLEHRLTAGKLAAIFEKAAPILGKDELEVDLEHDVGFITQFPISGTEVIGTEVIISLEGRHTACLAPEICCPPEPSSPLLSLGRKG